MSSIPPGDINTQPNAKIVFSAPYGDKHTYHIKIINASGRSIGWAIKTTNMKRLGVDPACGVLDPKEATLTSWLCHAMPSNLDMRCVLFSDLLTLCNIMLCRTLNVDGNFTLSGGACQPLNYRHSFCHHSFLQRYCDVGRKARWQMRSGDAMISTRLRK
ncbi:hypothetical protein KIN20_015494 [Parelaphostrongylus tenuis]|uniref:Major sperm protein n=1 Tax=Parelaphostrongylus tenuis TaxID=148309 RepID=A0AAD5MEZ9_PARTN|nr:hypothetical protein KIN20_015494 [Parelaphostrongylus tenuis]